MRRRMYILIALLLAAASCGLFENKKDAEPPPGRRDYTWTVDTIANEPGGFLYDIWGASPNDVWAVSATGIHPLWHFDGSQWSPWSREVSAGFECVYGISADNVWAGGINGGIYHFNGEKWSVAFTYTIKGMGQPEITDIWGTSPANIYAIGVAEPDTATSGSSIRSFLLHYDGQSWKQLLVTNFGIQFQRVRVESKKIFITATQNGPPFTYLLYLFDNGRLIQLDSNTTNMWIGNVGDQIYFTMGNRVKTYKRGSFSTMMVIPADSETIIGVDGRSRNDLFTYTFNGVMHYNGTNYKYLLRVPGDIPRYPFREMIFKNQVFFTVWDVKYGVTNLIVHGVLPDTTNNHNQ